MLHITQQIEQPLNSITFAINGMNKSKPQSELKTLEQQVIFLLKQLETTLKSIKLTENTPIEEAQEALPIVYYFQDILEFYYELLKRNPASNEALLEQYWNTLDALENLELALDMSADAELRQDLSDAIKGDYKNFSTYDPTNFQDKCTE